MTRISDTPAPFGTPRKPGISLDFVSPGSVIDLPAEALAKAVRNVASHARDTADARLLLDVLGLEPATAAPTQTDCDPAMPRIPVAIEVDMTTTRLHGRHIRDIPTRGLL